MNKNELKTIIMVCEEFGKLNKMVRSIADGTGISASDFKGLWDLVALLKSYSNLDIPEITDVIDDDSLTIEEKYERIIHVL